VNHTSVILQVYNADMLIMCVWCCRCYVAL